jgi:hypothetical protein
MFSKLAEGSASEAVRAVKELAEYSDREAALSALVGGWQAEGGYDPRQEFATSHLGNEARLLARLLDRPALAAEAARELLSGGEREQLIRMAAVAETARDPQAALSLGGDLQGKARSEFLQAVARGWAQHHGEAALTWALGEADPELRAHLQMQAMIGWGLTDPEAAARHLGDMSEPAGREEALRTIAVQWGAVDTQAALAWARGLPDAGQREQAVAAIQSSAPVGIGVSLGSSPDGLPVVNELIPGGAASSGGQLKAGYQIAAIGDGRGGFTELRGVKLNEVASMIRGKPGTVAVLQVIPAGGNPASRMTITVPRQQLLFKRSPAADPR